jgi:hypothetical protein
MLLASKKMSSQEQAGWNGRIGPQLGAGLWGGARVTRLGDF